MEEQNTSAVKIARSDQGRTSDSLRKIAVLSSIGLADFIPISLYQLGVIKHLPDPPGRLFDSDKVNGSKEAQVAGVPDGVVSLCMYGATMAVAGAGLSGVVSPGRTKLLLGGILVGQALGGAYYLLNMITVQKKICPYCVMGALVNFASLFPLVSLFKKRSR